MAKFIKSSFVEKEWILDNETEFCFVGRSNVGKSSLINSMAKEKIAITSKTPGRTRLVNFFQFKDFRLIDLPGYGFANVGKEKKIELVGIIEKYLTNRINLFGVFQIIDINVFSNEDKVMSNFLKSKFKNYFVIVNKIDKVSKNILNKNIEQIAKIIQIEKENIIPVSSKRNLGINLIFNKISSCLKSISEK
ncbi:MAG: ribosome biogenesis GTP-binding protein YihA/YsxC [Mycoplasmataceae bacterium]|nr:ribosome biogenesis GTP-binding protein YihA/YsxC [Mycoplasmataceae bacterium]